MQLVARALDIGAGVLFISGLLLLSVGLNSDPSGIRLIIAGYFLLTAGFAIGLGAFFAQRPSVKAKR